MCNFKSGIILKGKCVIAESSDESHTKLLENLNIVDDRLNAMTTFVRAELLPPNGKWWTDPSTWKFHVDQDILPEWYLEDKEKYEQDFRKTIYEWVKVHIITNDDIDILKSGYYRVKNCTIKTLSNDVNVFLEDSEVEKMESNSCIDEMHGKSKIKEMHDFSNIQKMYADSFIGHMYDKSSVKYMYYNSTVFEMDNESNIYEMHGESVIKYMCGYAFGELLGYK